MSIQLLNIMKSTEVQTLSAYCTSYIHILRSMPMRVRGKLATPRVMAVCTRVTPTRASSFWARLNVVDTRWVTSGASLCVERKRLTAGKPVNSCFAA